MPMIQHEQSNVHSHVLLSTSEARGKNSWRGSLKLKHEQRENRKVLRELEAVKGRNSSMQRNKPRKSRVLQWNRL